MSSHDGPFTPGEALQLLRSAELTWTHLLAPTR